ncbi:MAG TPA: ATP phosphoribosyltransferase [Sediminibacterium sp.]|uniref:ATP phosphoribosyltransferase n=1 Tax=Sediminibacterium sp. TaxID=1917865 RepID=UPI0008ABFE5C|nr:ATP phosphoribosyltransferase [Sediminibacterium sp.]OHC85359.1 MAG: ATP phosphoribosyltransferase [Sphingobacteriia bacterium RIFOXYC2_FULL_35_18]OHC89403.1 MAG: ATP phosphoribosyltransferase [Sphingobacteriia bacterium RIFOXYD2_FULL_35_12]OYY09442.1 MAG: ATP phosphoribosyltransferase [Sphingobacteriia bacterium 35-36-14]OYZ53761.1 MAG: ATP phosphoribosyltransferase [Sphingobacteriia bacterium 24-36-13]OZA62529.1 MAG: ATP phosphoribosyltransferase [Sphingobacteriia bacterium 39-39-8]
MKNNNENYKLRLAIQKSGRLHDDSMRLLKECGIDISNGVNKLKADATNFPIEVFFLRDDDIPQYVEDGVADIGFVGENVVFEKNKKVEIEEKLGFGKCRLSMAVQRNEVYENAYFLQNKKIATSYPVIVSNFLKTKGIEAEIHEISGSVEIAPGIGLADAICDLVSSGSTLFMNGLKEVEVIFESQAVLIKNNLLNEVQQQLLQRLIFRIQSVKKAKNNKYILLNAPNNKLDEIIGLLPGMKSPTVLPLATEGWSSVHSVLNENDFWNIIEQLKAAGAEGILVVPIEKMII